MKQIDCPNIGSRPISEFTYGGEVKAEPNPDETDDTAWTDYLFSINGGPGLRREWWHHGPSGTWFIIERDTLTDSFIRVVSGEEGLREP